MRRRLPPALLRNPFELLIAYLCVTAGAPLLVIGAPATPDSLDDLLPGWLVHTWAASLLLGGLLIAFGLLRGRQTLTTYRVKRSGLALLCGMCVVYATAIFTTGNPSSWFAGATYLISAGAFWVRYYTIGLVIKGLLHVDDPRYLSGGRDA